MKIQNALVSNIFDRSQRYFAHVTTVTLSWSVQNIVMIGRVYFTLECFEFSSNFEFDRNMLSGTGARWLDIEIKTKLEAEGDDDCSWLSWGILQGTILQIIFHQKFFPDSQINFHLNSMAGQLITKFLHMPWQHSIAHNSGEEKGNFLSNLKCEWNVVCRMFPGSVTFLLGNFFPSFLLPSTEKQRSLAGVVH